MVAACSRAAGAPSIPFKRVSVLAALHTDNFAWSFHERFLCSVFSRLSTWFVAGLHPHHRSWRFRSASSVRRYLYSHQHLGLRYRFASRGAEPGERRHGRRHDQLLRCDGHITVGSTLAITESVTINGPGANVLAISGNSAVQVFSFSAAAANSAISGLTIMHGSAQNGGGIRNIGTITVNNSVVAGNTEPGNPGDDCSACGT